MLDLRHALRALRRTPGFTLTAILSLALGLGATNAMFAVVNGVLLRPPPYAEPDRLVLVWTTSPSRNMTRLPSSEPDFRDFRRQAQAFEEISAYSTGDHSLQTAEVPERVRGLSVAGDMLKVLKVHPALGRGFLPEEEIFGQHRVVLISQGLWKRRFGKDPAVLGKSLNLDGQEHTIVGVLPPEVDFPRPDVTVWVPLAFEPGQPQSSRGNRSLEILGRLRPGITMERANKELETISRRLEQEHSENSGLSATALSLHEYRVGDLSTGLFVLMGSVAFVLLIACANLANLLLARGGARRKEMAIRTTLGATRGRLVRQLLTESVLLSVLGSAVGTVLAWVSMDGLLALAPNELSLVGVVLDLRVSAFALAVAVITGMIFGLVPALRLSGDALAGAIRESSISSPSGNRLRASLVVAEVALTVMLLVGAGLLLRSFQRLIQVSPGLSAERVLTVSVSLPSEKFSKPAQVSSFTQQLQERFTAFPSVESSGAIFPLPMDGHSWKVPCSVEGRPEPEKLEDVPLVDVRVVSGELLRSLGISVMKGRPFGPEDGPDSQRVVLLNQAAARAFFPDEEPVGKRLWTGPPEHFLPEDILSQLPGHAFPRLTVVGVVKDVRSQGPRMPAIPEVYLPVTQQDDPVPGLVFTLKSASDPVILIPLVRKALAEVDPALTLGEVKTMEAWMEGSVAQPRFYAVLLTLFAGLSMALAMVGVGGVMGYSVSQRTREFGIRMAIGSTAQQVMGLVFKRGFLWVGSGLALGLVGALSLTRVISSLLFNVSAVDPGTYAAVVLGLATVAGLSIYLPARQATRVDPATALRPE
ncbi:ABC transporter permease [Hyalangium versicolor]|uniref:ABC transporter permease n=1 Tax=Hyalangium versicolor TaxID=2861190 RepID=UPI001CCCF5A7|nr:ABC transporter permease [Hyalangium versicolor]